MSGLVLALTAAPALALHRNSPPAIRIASGGSTVHPSTRSWKYLLGFSSPDDLLGNGSAGRQIFVFSLFLHDCALCGPTTFPCPDATQTGVPCPSTPQPYYLQITNGPGSPDNPSVSPANGTANVVAFDADGAYTDSSLTTPGVGVGRRQIFVRNVTTGVTTRVTDSTMGDSVKPSLNSSGGSLVFESDAPLLGGAAGVKQIFIYQLATARRGANLVQVTQGQGPSINPMLPASGSGPVVFQTQAQLDAKGKGPATGTWQIYWYDQAAQVVHALTSGSGDSQHPYIAESSAGLVMFDSVATNIPGTAGDAGPQIYQSKLSASTAPSFTQLTGPHAPGGPANAAALGTCTYPAIESTGSRVAMLCTGDALQNGTSGNRLFVLTLPNDAQPNVLFQLTADGHEQGPVGYSLGVWLPTVVTTADLTGTGVCGHGLFFLDFCNAKDNCTGKLQAAVDPGSLPLNPRNISGAPGDPNAGCTDGNPCTDDQCASGFCNHPALSGTPCPATNCKQVGTCDQGVCQQPPKSCDDQNGCTLDSCDPSSGCQHAPIANCTPCSTDQDCTTGNPCRVGTCTAGACAYSDKQNGTACQTNVCKQGGTCSAGACTNEQPVTCQDPCAVCDLSQGGCSVQSGCRSCTTPDDCIDGNPCRDHTCTSGKCAYTNADGRSCADANVCNGNETCLGGTCHPGTALVCNQQGACFPGTCDPVQGCQYPQNPTPGCTPCSSPGDCTALRQGNPCKTDNCVNGACQNPPLPDGTSCDADHNFCNGVDRCQQGACIPASSPLDCDDEIQCTTDTCQAATGCAHAPNDALCDDGIPCTMDTCTSGGCAHTPNAAACDDGNPCTADQCDPILGCVHQPITPCTPCDDHVSCTVDVFDAQSGTCMHVPNDASCDDGNVCTDDVCDPALGCRHSIASCSDGDECTVDTCNPSGTLANRCSHVELPGFDDAFCRLAQLEHLMSDPPLKRGLAALVARAGRRISKAQAVSPTAAYRHLRVAEGTLRLFIARLIGGGTNLPRSRAVDIAHKAREVLKPVSALRAQYTPARTRH